MSILPVPIDSGIRPIPLSEWRERVLILYAPPLRARTTHIAMRRALDLFCGLEGLETTGQIDALALARFVASRKGLENPNTTRNHLKCLSAAFTIALAEGWIRASPFAYRKQWVRGVTPKAPRVHSREELARALDHAAQEAAAADPRHRWKARRAYALLATVAYTGVRKMEALTLRAEDVLLHERVIVLVDRERAGLKTPGASQPVPMPEALANILRGWLAFLGTQSEWLFPSRSLRTPWTGGTFGSTPLDALRELGERAGVEGLTFQGLRHSWATHAEYWGLTDAQIQRVLRHTNTRTQWHYRHAERANMTEMVRGIDFRDRPADGDGDRTRDVADRAAEPRREPPPAIVPPGGQAAGMDPMNVEYRPVPGFPRHRLGSDRSCWTNLDRSGNERPGDLPGPWRRLVPYERPGSRRGPVFTLRRDGRGHQRTLASLMAEVFPDPGR